MITIPLIVLAQSKSQKTKVPEKQIVENIEKIRTVEKVKLPPFPVGTIPEPPKPVVASNWVVTQLSVSEQQAKLYIYNHESGNNPTRWNTSGCLGLGQACPASKLLAVCPNMDYACEDAWFTNYAVKRYGGWIGAYQFWLSHHWW